MASNFVPTASKGENEEKPLEAFHVDHVMVTEHMVNSACNNNLSHYFMISYIMTRTSTIF